MELLYTNMEVSVLVCHTYTVSLCLMLLNELWAKLNSKRDCSSAGLSSEVSGCGQKLLRAFGNNQKKALLS